MGVDTLRFYSNSLNDVANLHSWSTIHKLYHMFHRNSAQHEKPGIGNKAKQREPALFNFSSNGIYFLGIEYVCGRSHGQILLLGIVST